MSNRAKTVLCMSLGPPEEDTARQFYHMVLVMDGLWRNRQAARYRWKSPKVPLNASTSIWTTLIRKAGHSGAEFCRSVTGFGNLIAARQKPSRRKEYCDNHQSGLDDAGLTLMSCLC